MVKGGKYLATIGIGLLAVLQTSCFRRFRMTEKDLDLYYQSHSPRPESKTIEQGKHHLHFVQTGSDSLPLLLMIHGAPGAWYGYISYLSDSLLHRKFAIASVDRPGYHKSKIGGKTLSIIQQADLIAHIFRSDTTRPVYLLGRSYGAPIAAVLAARFPKQVKGLVLVAPAVNPELEKYWWFSGLIRVPPIRWFLPSPINMASDEKHMHAKELYAIKPYWSQIQCPTTILQGKADWIVKPENALFADSALTSAPHKLYMLDGVEHLVTRERPDLVKHILKELVEEKL